MNYSWEPVFKFVPTDGPEEVASIRDLFTDLPGCKKVEAEHRAEQTARKDVNRLGANRKWGFRPMATLHFEIVDTNQQRYLALIASRLMSDVFTCYLSLDGGLTFRRVQLAANGYKGPKALGGKTFIGADYELEVEGCDLLYEAPALAEGTW